MRERFPSETVHHVVGGPQGVLPPSGFRKDAISSPRSRVWQAAQADVTVRRVCAICNNTWLSDLEEQTRTLLEPCVLGTRKVVFGPKAQTVIARWAIKTATLMRYVRDKNFPEPRKGELDWLRTNHTPPPQTGVWLGANGWNSARLRIQRPT